jgi:hypothetical protein
MPRWCQICESHLTEYVYNRDYRRKEIKMEEEEIKLEVGKVYLTRGGDKVTVHAVGLNLGSGYTVLATREYTRGAPESIETYAANGNWLTEIHGLMKPNDIISEYNPWLAVPVDTKIRVRDHTEESWQPRHFARWDAVANSVRAWDRGCTSYTIENAHDGATCNWRYAEVVE